jgi:hypothetical protein
MPKDDREILQGIRFPIQKDDGRPRKERASRLFTSGMEDELAEAATQEQLDGWVADGALKGTWKHKAASKSTDTEDGTAKKSPKK